MITYIPNILTILRIVLTFLAIALVSLPPESLYAYLFVIFIVAAVTDFADGYLARKFEVISDFGKVFDPLADKVLSFIFLIILYGTGTVPDVVILLLIVRDLVIDSIRGMFTAHIAVIQAIFSAKLKTLLTFVFIATALFELTVGSNTTLHYATVGLSVSALVLSYASALQYGRIFLKVYKDFRKEKKASSII